MRWWQKLKQRWSRPAAQPGEDSAAHGGDTPRALHPGRRRLKETYTSHWDLDYLPRDRLEELHDERRR